MRFVSRTPVRTFILYPLVTLIWEYGINRGEVFVHPVFIALMIWGYLQYLFCGRYRIKHGGGGPGLETPPDHLVSSGPYALTRNPMYLGHLIYLTGLTLTLRSWLAGLITVSVAVWFHYRVIRDEKRLATKLGAPYLEYIKTVRRWIPGLF
jgi:protein-S-isoprenylcysteine O-methyltransferase Ste14